MVKNGTFASPATARASKRANEVGVRKVVGSYRRQLVQQFLTESLFLSVLAFVIALVLVGLISLIIFLPENKLIPYRLELSGLNRRLNKLMKQELPQWLSYNRCLATTRAEALAAPE